MTFSICVRDTATGEFGVATSSAFVAAGGIVPAVRPGVGAAATQASALLGAADRMLDAVAAGADAATALAGIVEQDDASATRQLAVLTATGVATHTGAETIPHQGEARADDAVAVFNLCANDAIADAMVAAWSASSGRLPARMLAALRAGDAAGGDRRGRDSAGMAWTEEGEVRTLRIDLGDDPIEDLARAWGYQQAYGMLDEFNEGGDDAPAVEQILETFDDGQLRAWLADALRSKGADGRARELLSTAGDRDRAFADLLSSRRADIAS